MMRPNRRSFLKNTGIGSLAVFGSSRLPAATRAAIDNTEPMKITRIDAITFRKDLHIGGGSGGSEDGAEFWWVRLHTDKGIQGLGETYPFPQAEVGALKEHAELIMGRDPRDIDGIWRDIHFEGAMRTTGGADMRMLSAINMAQLDILGQASGLPLYRCSGGKRDPECASTTRLPITGRSTT
jgi:L-alanine-DL-glutamate epimerase-like enolase superfamily enzyme